MGGCSSRPKTAEFEAAMEVQEDKPQDDAVRNSVEEEKGGADGGLKGIDKEQEPLGNGARSAFVEEECSDSRGMLSETDKKSIAGFDEQGASKMEMQVLVEDCSYAKQSVEEETTLHLPILDKELIVLSPESSQLPKDSKLMDVSTTEARERSMVSTIGEDTGNSQDKPFAFCNQSVEMQVQTVLPEYETPTAQEPACYDEEASHPQGKAFNSQDAVIRSEKDAYMESERSSVPRDSDAPEGLKLELQKEPEAGEQDKEHMLVASPRETKQVDTMAVESQAPQEATEEMVEWESQNTPQEARDEMVELESQDTVHKNGGQRLIGSPEQENEAKKSTDCELSSNGISTPDSFTGESRKDFVGDEVLLLGNDQRAKDEAVEASNSVISLNDQQFYSLNDGVHEEQMEAKIVNATGITCTESVVKSQGEPVLKDVWPVANDLRQESAGELASDDSWYILEKVDVEDSHPSTSVKEHIDVDWPKNADGDSRETSKNAVNCDKEVLSPVDQVADPPVRLAMKEKLEPQPVHGMDPVGLAFKDISDQEIPARDIDDILEKLASEFERQESLARSTP